MKKNLITLCAALLAFGCVGNVFGAVEEEGSIYGGRSDLSSSYIEEASESGYGGRFVLSDSDSESSFGEEYGPQPRPFQARVGGRMRTFMHPMVGIATLEELQKGRDVSRKEARNAAHGILQFFRINPLDSEEILAAAVQGYGLVIATAKTTGIGKANIKNARERLADAKKRLDHARGAGVSRFGRVRRRRVLSPEEVAALRERGIPEEYEEAASAYGRLEGRAGALPGGAIFGGDAPSFRERFGRKERGYRAASPRTTVRPRPTGGMMEGGGGLLGTGDGGEGGDEDLGWLLEEDES